MVFGTSACFLRLFFTMTEERAKEKNKDVMMNLITVEREKRGRGEHANICDGEVDKT